MNDVAVLFGVFSAVANIVIALIAARGRWWEKSDKMEAFVNEIRAETSTILKEMDAMQSLFNEMKTDYKQFSRDYATDIRDIQSQVYSHAHRIADLERRLNAK
jgi:chloramphenicol O-acetyltransferase